MANHKRTMAAAGATMLASLSLYPIFIGMAWFWAGVGAVLTVAIAGTLTRLRRLPVFVCLLGSLAALLLYLNAAFESARARYHLLPTPNSLRELWDLAGTGFTQSAKYAPPVPELPGMLLLAAAGIGLTAVLTDLIAVRLASAALAGLPLLLLYTEPFTLSVARSGLGTTIVFCLGVAGYLAMLSSEGKDRIKEWERPNPGPNEIPDTSVLSMTGRRVGAASMVLALCVPLVIPGLHATRLFGGQPGIGGTGGAAGGGVSFPDPNVVLTHELLEKSVVPVLSYTTTDARPQYFQLYVADNLTDSGWQLEQPKSLVDVRTKLPPAPGLTSAVAPGKETTLVQLSDNVAQDQLAALPVPYPATSVSVKGDVRADRNSLMVFENGVPLAGLSYTVTSLDESSVQESVLNTAPPAPDAITRQDLDVPGAYDVVKPILANVLATAGATTPFKKAVALQEWLSGGAFTYTTKAPSIVDAPGLLRFLKTTKKGYCQQFAFAMAVLARMAGIPARVAYGYTEGSQVNGGRWLVTTHDAHAWPELYFQGAGWLRFEPTPGGATGQGTATSPDYTQQPANPFTPSNPGSTTPSSQPSSGATGGNGPTGKAGNILPPNVVSGFGNGGGLTPRNTVSAVGVLLIVGFSLLGLAVLVAAAPAVARLVIRRARWHRGERGGDSGRAHAAWRELRDDLVDYRVGYQPSETPRALAARVGEVLELPAPAVAALRAITMAEERARYAARPDLGAGLRQDSAVVRRAIDAASTRRTRWLARLLPSSVIAPAMVRVIAVADFSGKLSPGWFGKTRLGGSMLGRMGLGRDVSAGAGAESGHDGMERREPPVAAGARRD